MVNSYSTPVNYGYPAVTQIPANNPEINANVKQPKKKTSAPYTFGGLALGAGAGALIGYKTNPYITKKGDVVNSFAQKSFDLFINKNDDTAKKVYNETKNVLESLNCVKTPEDLRTLMNKNKEFFKDMCKELKQTPEQYIRTITEDNLKANTEAISARAKAMNNSKLQSFKNQIQACWDKTRKEFRKSSDVSQDAFDAIKKASSEGKNKLIAKYAIIGGISTALVGFISYHAVKFIKNRKQAQAMAQVQMQAQNGTPVQNVNIK